MYFVDFIFDGNRLSDFGCMVGSAVTSNEDSIAMGSQIELNTVVNHGSFLSEIVNADYKEMYSVTFDILKKSCGNFDGEFSDKEAMYFMRWLNRKEYCKFIPIYDDGYSFYNVYLMGTFTECKAIHFGNKIVGFTLTFMSNSPFGHTEVRPKYFTMNSENNYSFTIYDNSDELGSSYPKKIVFTINSIGSSSSTLSIVNSQEPDRHTVIKNVSVGEIITIDCIHKVITTSLNYKDNSGNDVVGHPAFYNDFNYVYPRMSNTLNNNANVFTSENNIGCDIEIEYDPVRKVGVIA